MTPARGHTRCACPRPPRQAAFKTAVGETVAVTPLGAPDTASDTEPAAPEVTAVEIVAAEFAPGAMLSVEGDAVILKSLAATPLTEIAALVPLDPVDTVPAALIVRLPVVRKTTPV